MSDNLFRSYLTVSPVPSTAKPLGTLPDINYRLNEIDLKLSRLQSVFVESLSRLESSVEFCQQSIESFKAITTKIEELCEDPQRNVVFRMKLAQNDSNAPSAQEGTSGARTESLAEEILTSSAKTEPEFKKVGSKNRLKRVYSRVKQSVRKVFSGPCVVTPIFEIYPARMFQKPAAGGGGGSKVGGGHQ